jgi:hypothetical protein
VRVRQNRNRGIIEFEQVYAGLEQTFHRSLVFRERSEIVLESCRALHKNLGLWICRIASYTAVALLLGYFLVGRRMRGTRLDPGTLDPGEHVHQVVSPK